MIGHSEFDLWAAGYDEDVRESDAKGEYPFAGYAKLMHAIYNKVMANAPARILDVGIGTGTLSAALYNGGCEIVGTDFAPEMLKIAQGKMPNARLLQWDFSSGVIPPDLANEKFDFIISTYALHHLTDADKLKLIPLLKSLLHENGVILIGDIGFPTPEDLQKCEEAYTDLIDYDEFFFIVSELAKQVNFPVKCQQISYCCVLLEIS